MKIGTIAYPTMQGIGFLAKWFYDAGVVDSVMTVAHSKHKNHYRWFPNGTRASQGTIASRFKTFADGLDAMLFFETPFDWKIIPICREMGIKTFLMPMYECMPKVLPYVPDRYICPSLLDLKYYPDNSTWIPIPVDVKWRQRTRAEVFIHNAGHGGLMGRNGTSELLMAMEHVKSDLKLIVRCQENAKYASEWQRYAEQSPSNVVFQRVDLPFEELYSEGDVFVFPEKFNGLSLPLQEARASGMVVMSPKRFPMDIWLPHEYLIPVSSYRTTQVSGRCNDFELANVEPIAIAETMDACYGQDITQYSNDGQAWARTMSWDELKPQYLEHIREYTR